MMGILRTVGYIHFVGVLCKLCERLPRYWTNLKETTNLHLKKAMIKGHQERITFQGRIFAERERGLRVR